jgi:hypothetical protein
LYKPRLHEPFEKNKHIVGLKNIRVSKLITDGTKN